MADADHRKVKVKNINIQNIFESMEYGENTESTGLAELWLQERQRVIYAYIDKREEISKGVSTEITCVNNREPLVRVYSPLSEDIEKIILKSKQNTEWSRKGAIKRATILDRFANEIERNSKIFCQLEVLTRGILSKDTKSMALPLLTECLQYYASWALKYESENAEWTPEGITVSILSEDNFLAAFGYILGPALAAGYNIILQTAPRISLIAALIIELAEKVGIPEGVIKLVPGYVDLDCIFNHEHVAVISNFGSLYASKYQGLKKPLQKKFLSISYSKIPMIVFNNGDLDSACDALVDAAWGYGSLLPWSVHTVIVQEDVFEMFVAKLKHRLSKVKMDSATSKIADASFSIRTRAAEKLQQAVADAKLQGIEVFQNDPTIKRFQPTLFIGGRLFGNSTISEDFDLPAVTLLAFRTSNEGVSLANNSRYGFGASVWTENIGLANEVAQKLHAANIWINSYGHFSAYMTMTPYKQSGTGYFGGPEGFLEYINVKTSSLINENLPQQTMEHALQSGETGFIDSVYLTGKDLKNAIMVATKAQTVWGKMTISERNKLLRKIANEIDNRRHDSRGNIPVQQLDSWILATYKGITPMDNFGNTVVHKSFDLKSYREPIGIVIVDEMDKSENDINQLIIGALLLGNSVIILNRFHRPSQLFVEIYKLLTACGLPAGVFNVILNCKEEVLRTIIHHKESIAYFTYALNDSLNKTYVQDLKYFYSGRREWSEILMYITKAKTIWSNIGDSVL